MWNSAIIVTVSLHLAIAVTVPPTSGGSTVPVETPQIHCCSHMHLIGQRTTYALNCRGHYARYPWCFVCRSYQCIIFGQNFTLWAAEGLSFKYTIRNWPMVGCHTYNRTYASVKMLYGDICMCAGSSYCNRQYWLPVGRSFVDSDDTSRPFSHEGPIIPPLNGTTHWSRTLAIIIGVASVAVISAFFCICWQQHGPC